LICKNLSAELNNFKASSEKQRQSTMASIAKAQETSKQMAKENADLKRTNQHLEMQNKAAYNRIKAIAENLENAAKEMSATKK
jgi:hypothetical protein